MEMPSLCSAGIRIKKNGLRVSPAGPEHQFQLLGCFDSLVLLFLFKTNIKKSNEYLAVVSVANFRPIK